jgi:hypothetical protein
MVPVRKTEIKGLRDLLRCPRHTLVSSEVGTNFADKQRLLGRYRSLVD